MRSLALTALLGSFIASTSLVGQSLTEHAAAAAGATIGTAAGKPLGTALGKIFGDMDKTTSNAATPKTAKPAGTKSEAKIEATAPATLPTATLPPAGGVVLGSPSGSGGGGGGGDVGGGGGTGASSHHSARRRELPIESESGAAVPTAPIVAEPVVKEPSVEEVASIQVGASSSELRALGAPESKVSIPGDDGHLLEICQYWAKGEPIGTIRLDNGRVISVQVRN
jgi:hypothetical protein